MLRNPTQYVCLSSLALALLCGAPAGAQEAMPELTIEVGIKCSLAVPAAVLAEAQATATRIYTDIGVTLGWRSGRGTAIWMEFEAGLDPQMYPGALGYAMPYGKTGTRIRIFVDRVLMEGSPRLRGALLGNVMAHELGHVLEGFSRHADSGVMKAHWDRHDRAEMLVHPLSFSSEDARWIHESLDGGAFPGSGSTASERAHK